jgi:iron-sulfur cluster assembly protein
MTDKPISFSASAHKKIEELVKSLNVDEKHVLRVGIKGGGCAGFDFLLAFDEIGNKDNLYEIEGIKVAIEKAHVMHVLGMTIDYEESELNKGFVFVSP